MATKSADYGYVNVATSTAAAATTAVAATLVFTPGTYGKVVILASACGKKSSAAYNAAVSLWVKEGAGSFVEVCETNSAGRGSAPESASPEEYSFLYFTDGAVSTQYTIELRHTGVFPGSDLIHCHITAFAVNKWDVIEQPTDTTYLESNANRTSKILMQQELVPTTYDSLVFAYAEVTSDEAAQGSIHCYINEDSNENTTIAGLNFGAFSGTPKELVHTCLGTRRMQLNKANQRFIWQLTKADSSASLLYARRCRILSIPLDEPPIVAVQSIDREGKIEVSDRAISFTGWHTFGADELPTIGGDMSGATVHSGEAYIGLFSFRTGAAEALKNEVGNLVIRERIFNPQLTDTSHTNQGATTTYPGLTVAAFRPYLYQTRGVGNDASPVSEPEFGFEQHTTVVGGASSNSSSPNDASLGAGWQVDYQVARVIETGPLQNRYIDNIHGTILTLQNDVTETDITGFAGNDPKTSYAVRTLVEIHRTRAIDRFSLEEDTYLFEGSTPAQIRAFYQAGQIDRNSLADLTVTGRQALEALDAGDTAQADDLLALTTGTPDGITPSVLSGYRNKDSIGALYKGGLLKDVKVSDTTSLSHSGTISTNTASITLSNKDQTYSSTSVAEEFLGGIIKVRYYDKTNNELRTAYSGRITDVDVGDSLTIKAINPNIDVMDVELPATTIQEDVTVEDGSKRATLSDDPDAVPPIFFGTAKRLLLPHAHKDFGNVSGLTSPPVDSTSTYLVGGNAYDTDYEYVVPDTEKATGGFYRGWLEISDLDNIPGGVDVNSNYQLKGRAVPTVQFVARRIDTSTATPTNVPVPRTIGDNPNDDLTATYPNFSPIDSVTSIIGLTPSATYDEGVDWRRALGVDRDTDIVWLAGITPTTSAPAATSHVAFDRTAPGDEDNTLMSGNLVEWLVADGVKMTEVTSISGISHEQICPIDEAGIRYVEDVHYSLDSVNTNRNHKDEITWLHGNVAASYSFAGGTSGALLDTTTNNNDLIGIGGQPYTNSAGTALEFGTSIAGTGHLELLSATTAGITWNHTAGTTSTNPGWRAKAWVQAAGVTLQGHIMSKLDDGGFGRSAGATGWTIEAKDASNLTPAGSSLDTNAFVELWEGGGVPTGTLVGASSTMRTKLNDGEKHSVELCVPHTGGYVGTDHPRAVLLVDDKIEAVYNSTIGLDTLEGTTAPFQLGGTMPTITTPEPEMLIHKVQLCGDAMAPPPVGDATSDVAGLTTPFRATVTYTPDSYYASWNYTKTTYTDPIQPAGSLQPVGADVSISGAQLALAAATGTITPTGLTNAYWVSAPASLGYALRLNQSDPDSTWTLGSSGLSVSTYLGSSNLGKVTVPNNNSTMKFTGANDFCVYGYAIWRGGPDQDGILIAKETSSGATPSYCLGISAGKIYGGLTVDGTFVSLTGSASATARAHVDNKTPVLLMMEKKGALLNLYVNGSEAGSTTLPSAMVDGDYDTSDLVIGSDAPTSMGQRWSGDVMFVGIAAVAPGAGFAKYQMGLIADGVKGGCIDETTLHIPFIEGTGTTVKARNLHTNPAQSVKRILTSRAVGLNEQCEGRSFDDVITILDDAGLKADVVMANPVRAQQIIEGLLRMRGMRLRKSTEGLWKITVPVINQTVVAKFGQGDGIYENIISIKTVDYLATDSAVKNLELKYRYYRDTEGNLKYHGTAKRSVMPYGTETQTVELPHILDDVTADKVADFMAKRIRAAKKAVSVTVGMEGRKLVIGDLVCLDVPRFGLDDEIFEVRGTSIGASTNTLQLVSYSNAPFTYDKGATSVDTIISGEKSS